jgi:hypothetical protein
MTAEQVELMKQAARTLLAHRDSGRICDPHQIAWAESLLSANPHARMTPADADPFDGAAA